MKKPFEPNFNTPDDQLCKEELNKLNLPNLNDQMAEEFRNSEANISWEIEQIAKSSGLYLEFDRSIKKGDKHWMYMLRLAIPAGGPIDRKSWNLLHELSEKYTKDPDGNTSLRATTRQTFQLHWLSKEAVLDIVRTMAENGINSLNGCGDNTRNVLATPYSAVCNIFNGNEIGQKLGEYFQLPLDPFIKVFAIEKAKVRKPGESFSYGKKLLNRKFKIAVSGFFKDPETGEIVPDNSTEIRTNDLGIAPILENGKVTKFQIYVGGGQGERNGKPSGAMLGQPLCRCTEDQLQAVADAIVSVHQKWGDRQNRHWARLKYVIKKEGVDWFRQEVEKFLKYELEDADPNLDLGRRQLYHGWIEQPDGNLAYGMFIENGRITDASPNGKLKSAINSVMNKFDTQMVLTANQDVLFINISPDQKDAFEKELASFGYGQRNGKEYSELRKRSGACVGLYTCRLSYTESEQFEPHLLDELEKLGWGDLKESIGITGCERQCFRPATKAIGLVGSGADRYMFKLFGDEAASHQGIPLISEDGENLYLRSVPRDHVAVVIDTLFKFYETNKTADEGLGEYLRRMGPAAIIQHLKENDMTASLMEKPFNTACVLD